MSNFQLHRRGRHCNKTESQEGATIEEEEEAEKQEKEEEEEDAVGLCLSLVEPKLLQEAGIQFLLAVVSNGITTINWNIFNGTEVNIVSYA